MEQRVSVITLGVRNLERARRFYEEGLDWRRGNKGEDMVFFQANGIVLALFPWDLLANDVEVQPEGAGFRDVTLGPAAHGGRVQLGHIVCRDERKAAVSRPQFCPPQ